MQALADLLAKLRRRRVFRVAAVYAGVAFVITEVVSNTFDDLLIPNWVDSLIYVLLALGFSLVIGLAWAFDITDEGIVRAKGRPAQTGWSPWPA